MSDDELHAIMRSDNEQSYSIETDPELDFVGQSPNLPESQPRELSLVDSSDTLHAPVNEPDEISAGIRIYFPG